MRWIKWIKWTNFMILNLTTPQQRGFLETILILKEVQTKTILPPSWKNWRRQILGWIRSRLSLLIHWDWTKIGSLIPHLGRSECSVTLPGRTHHKMCLTTKNKRTPGSSLGPILGSPQFHSLWDKGGQMVATQQKGAKSHNLLFKKSRSNLNFKT